MKPRRGPGSFDRTPFRWLRPNQRLRWTGTGLGYVAVWLGLLGTGLYQQINLLLLTAGLAAGPIVASIFVSAAMFRKLGVTRRAPDFVFSGEPLILDYTLENSRRSTSALALIVADDLLPVDRNIPGANRVTPQVVFDRVPPRDRLRVRWQGPSPGRGKYVFSALDVVTRSPFGLLERRVTVPAPGELVVYPKIGRLTRRWQKIQRESTETRRGRRHDRTAQQQEYHGLRDYRAGDSPRWIHWRTSARLGQPMVKEFEQQSEQDLAVLLDPWLPRSKVTADQREALEAAIRFAATVCYDTCRSSGRRLLLGWTGPTPDLRQGPASVKLLHELLTQLAVLRGSAEGQLSALFDALPPPILREAMLIIVSTRPINLLEESERSTRLSGAAGRGLISRTILLDASHGDLDAILSFEEPSAEGPRSPFLTPRRDVPSRRSTTGNGNGEEIAAPEKQNHGQGSGLEDVR